VRIINTADYVSEADLASLSANDREAMYNGLDCCVTLELLETLLEQLDDETRAVYQLSLDLRGPILEMSMRGIRIDQRARDRVLAEKIEEQRKIENQLNRLLREGVGLDINYRSRIDLQHLFYDVLGIKPIRKRNAQGKYVPTVNRDAIEKLQIHYWAVPFCVHLLAIRDVDKKISFLKTGIDPDGRMRATFNIAGTKTGRLASSMSEFGTGTNLQNIDRSLRTIFIPDPGMKFINIDLEQGDSRNMGAMMWECFADEFGEAFAGSYLDACESGDLHTTVSQMTWPELAWPADGDPRVAKAVAEEIFYRQDSYRQTSKKLGHGTNYRGQPRTMAMHTKMPVQIIESFQNRYFGAFPVIPEYHKWIESELADKAMLRTLYGRVRYFFGRLNDATTLNEAVAYPSQSMTADAVNKAMIAIWRSSLPVQLLCQVHDSLLFQVPESLCDELVPQVLALGKIPLRLKNGRDFSVPNEAKVGWNWGDYDKKNPDENPYGIKPCPNGDDRVFKPQKKLTLLGKLAENNITL
jgi:DNA polymerase I